MLGLVTQASLSPGTRSQPYPLDLKCSSKCMVMAAADTDPTNDFKPAAEWTSVLSCTSSALKDPSALSLGRARVLLSKGLHLVPLPVNGDGLCRWAASGLHRRTLWKTPAASQAGSMIPRIGPGWSAELTRTNSSYAVWVSPHL